MSNAARVREYDPKLYKRCIKCRTYKPREDLTVDYDDGSSKNLKRAFGLHADSTDGLQSICMACKNPMNTAARNKNVAYRLRHHTGTRCLTQLGDLAPDKFTANLETYLGYKISKLVKHLSADLKEREGPKRKLRDALNEGYHIDHKKPLSTFQVILKPAGMGASVDWNEFKRCWALSNLTAIPAADNLAKGAKYDGTEKQGQTEEGKEEAKEDVSTQIEITADAEQGP